MCAGKATCFHRLVVNNKAIMQTRRVLIVDTDIAAALVTQHGLQRALGAAFSVIAASSPELEQIRSAYDSIDLLIIDPSSQNYTSNALIKGFHEAYPEAPVLILTAYDTPRLRREMRDLGIIHYLSKPIDLQRLELSVRLALGLEKAHNPSPAIAF